MKIMVTRIELMKISYGNGLSIHYRKRSFFKKVDCHLKLTNRELMQLLWLAGYIDTYSRNNSVCVALATTLPGHYDYAWLSLSEFIEDNFNEDMAKELLRHYLTSTSLNKKSKNGKHILFD